MPIAKASNIERRNAARRALTDEQAREVRLSMEKDQDVAERFGLHPSAIQQLRTGRTYGPLKPDEKAARSRRDANPNRALTVSEYMLLLGPQHPHVGGPRGQDELEGKDAAWECQHGRLPHDTTPPCGCWPQEVTKPLPQPQPEEVPVAAPDLSRGAEVPVHYVPGHRRHPRRVAVRPVPHRDLLPGLPKVRA